MKRIFTLENVGIVSTMVISAVLIGYLSVTSAVLFKKQFTRLSSESIYRGKSTLKTHEKPQLNLGKPKVNSNNEIKSIKLEDANTISIQGMIDGKSMALAQQQLAEKSLALGPEATIYIVVDSGGGYIFSGMDFIEYARALPNKIVTITKFAGSMAFQIVQHMDDRYILDTGVLMSHRAAGGVEGQFDGELESRLTFFKDMFDRLENQSAARMGLELDVYKRIIVNEFWSTGFRSVENKSADEVVRATCGASLLGTKKTDFHTMFGTFEVELSKCPLIRGILGVKAKGDANVDEEVMSFIISSYNNPELFLRKYILTDKFRTFIGE